MTGNQRKKVLVTGVSGQDGSYMVDFLLEKTPYNVYGMVRRTAKPDLSNLDRSIKNPRFHLVVGDMGDTQSIDNLVSEIKPDYFINLAAQSFVGSSWQIPELTFDVDATGVLRCLEAIRKYVPLCRFYNAGSSEEFGDVQYSPQDENHPLRARSPYGAAKIAARQLVKVWRESHGLYAIQGQLFNHESERRGAEFVTRKITLGVAQIAVALNERAFDPSVEIPAIHLGNLDAKRDWSHAEDFVEGIWRMLNQELYNPELNETLTIKNDNEFKYNYYKISSFLSKNVKEYVLSSGETHSIREFIEEAFAVAGVKVIDANPHRLPPIFKGQGEHQISYILEDGTPVVLIDLKFYRPCEVDLLHGDSTLARKDLGWSPQVSFEELVRRMVKHDIAHLTRTTI